MLDDDDPDNFDYLDDDIAPKSSCPECAGTGIVTRGSVLVDTKNKKKIQEAIRSLFHKCELCGGTGEVFCGNMTKHQ